MTIWAAVILVIALILAILNLLQGFQTGKSNLQDIILFLVALGVLVRIRFKTQEGEKEKLKEQAITTRKKKTSAATGARAVKKKAPAKKKAAKKKAPAKKKTAKKKAPAKKKAAKKNS